MKKSIIYYLSICLIASIISCKKLIEIESPKNQLTTDKVFADTLSATSALLNIYDILQNIQYPTSNPYLTAYSDEALSTTGSSIVWNQSVVPSNNTSNTANWVYLYAAIYQCNLITEQAATASRLPQAFSSKIKSEATFLRAYAYFYLLNIYGKVPLLLHSDVNENRSAVQSDSATVYTQIIRDLSDARSSLPGTYPTVGKVRATRACATALLAKVYLYQRNWPMAEAMATELIGSGVYTPLEPVTNVFKAASREAILQFSTPTGFTTEATSLIPSTASTVPTYYFTDSFYQSFEAGDLRKTNWIGTNTIIVNGAPVKYNYPAKYKNRVANTSAPENLAVLRIAEQFLIRAESRAWQNKLTGGNSAMEDLNLLRSRAGLPATTFTYLASALQAIYNERRHEFFFENCDRFLDLKRTGRLQQVMSANKATWTKTGVSLPIPAGEIIVNPKLIQNDGY